MRDKGRIPKVSKVIAMVWKEFPNQRLGELIGNVLSHAKGPHPDLFFVEDKTLSELLWAYRLEHGSPLFLKVKALPKSRNKKRKRKKVST